MKFTKAFSIFALAITTVSALPEPAPQASGGATGGVGGSISVTGTTDALTTVITGLTHLSGSSTAIVHALIETLIGSGEGDVAATASAVASILGQSAAYAQALQTVLGALEVCVSGSAAGSGGVHT